LWLKSLHLLRNHFTHAQWFGRLIDVVLFNVYSKLSRWTSWYGNCKQNIAVVELEA